MQADMFGRQALSLLAVALGLTACSGHLDRAVQVDNRFDGVYAGTVTQDPACGTEVRAISFQVTGGAISAQGGHRRSRLSGTVSFDGQVDLQNASGGNPVTGSIVNGTLVASETALVTTHKRHTRSGLDDPLALPCVWRYEAPRVPDHPPGS